MQSGKYPTVQWKKYRVSSLKIEKKRESFGSFKWKDFARFSKNLSRNKYIIAGTLFRKLFSSFRLHRVKFSNYLPYFSRVATGALGLLDRSKKKLQSSKYLLA